jgi:hypothetical protein
MGLLIGISLKTKAEIDEALDILQIAISEVSG